VEAKDWRDKQFALDPPSAARVVQRDVIRHAANPQVICPLSLSAIMSTHPSCINSKRRLNVPEA
jgi:hypothetical protein